MPNNHTRLQPPTKQTIQTVGLTQWTNRSFIPSRIIFLSEDAPLHVRGCMSMSYIYYFLYIYVSVCLLYMPLQKKHPSEIIYWEPIETVVVCGRTFNGLALCTGHSDHAAPPWVHHRKKRLKWPRNKEQKSLSSPFKLRTNCLTQQFPVSWLPRGLQETRGIWKIGTV